MKKLLLLPTVLFPYTFCLCLGLMFLADSDQGDMAVSAAGIACLVCLGLALIGNTVFLLAGRNDPAEALIRTALLVKIIHIPTYLLIFFFALSIGLVAFVFAIPLFFLLVIVDVITLGLSDMISLLALAKNLKQHTVASVLTLVCQFFFCADIVSLLVLRLRQKPDQPCPA